MATEKTITLLTSEGEKEVKKVEMEIEPIPFKAFGRTTRMSNIDLSKMIREQFQKVFHDLAGCYVGAAPGGNLTVALYFENNAEDIAPGKFKNLTNVQANIGVNKKDLFSMKAALNKKIDGVTYELNDATRDALAPFMYDRNITANPLNRNRWNNVINERKIPAGNLFQYGAERIIIEVTGLDIRRILQVIFGDSMVISTVVEGDKIVNKQALSVRYEPRFSKMLPDGQSFMINIEQFDKDAVEEYAKKENPQFITNYGITMF